MGYALDQSIPDGHDAQGAAISSGLAELARLNGYLGREVVDVAGFIDSDEAQCQAQIEEVAALRRGFSDISAGSDDLLSALTDLRGYSTDTRETVETSAQAISKSAGHARGGDLGSRAGRSDGADQRDLSGPSSATMPAFPPSPCR